MIKLLIAALIIACIAPLFIKGPDGEPIMTIDDWAIDLPEPVDEFFADIFSGRAPSTPALPGTPEAEPLKVYKWQDEDGHWHFSNTPPNMDVAQEVEIADVNLMEAYEAPEPVPEPSQSAAAPAMLPGGMPGPQQMQEMMDTVNSYQETMDQRNKALEEITGGN